MLKKTILSKISTFIAYPVAFYKVHLSSMVYTYFYDWIDKLPCTGKKLHLRYEMIKLTIDRIFLLLINLPVMVDHDVDISRTTIIPYISAV
jgi:hypothetical protein